VIVSAPTPIEAELTVVIGAARHDRPAECNGHRPLTHYRWRSEAAHPEAANRVVPRHRWSAAGRRDRTLVAVVMQAYLYGVSTRKVDDLGRVSKS
jgi:transposase-like protein